ncbi:hypothetical protein BMETH_68_0 [methanotrophic bacterial endosymbiont of Bathymodiolus sp.]|nr:hypothetical protein BMETH_68_0 [methanotrophic bacterial endosymbiont of Bathymodiolus sp.]
MLEALARMLSNHCFLQPYLMAAQRLHAGLNKTMRCNYSFASCYINAAFVQV